MFKKSAEQLSEGSEDDIAAISIALGVTSMYQDLQEGLAVYNANVAPAAASAAVPAAAAARDTDLPASKRQARAKPDAAKPSSGERLT